MEQNPMRTGREWAAIITREVPHRQLAMLLRTSDPDVRTAVLAEFRRWLHPRSEQWATWQGAWNAWTGAAANRAGCVEFRPDRCPQCRGRRIDMRRGAPCLGCRGTGAARWQRLAAGHASAPTLEAGAGDHPRRLER